MDRRMIELAKANMAIAEICEDHLKCEDCPLCLPGTGSCICKNKIALAKAEKLVEAEEEQPEAETEPQEPEETTPAEKRKRILDDAIEAVCNDRCEVYGEPEDNFSVICKMWETYLNAVAMPKGVYIDLTEQCVADMMILFKVGRSATALEDHRDTYVDIAGYAACAGGMCEE